MPGISEAAYVSDHRPTQVGPSPVHTVYVDNFIALGTDADAVRKLTVAVNQELQKKGLPTHEVDLCTTRSELLGWDINGATAIISPSSSRAWRLMGALDYLLRLHTVSAAEVERLVGHCTVMALVCRESLAVFRATYVFINKTRGQVGLKLWRSVRAELQSFRALTPLLYQDLRAGWHPHVCCFYASEIGGACAESLVPTPLVQHAGRFSERWRLTR